MISWGESTFLPNGINVINPVDLSKLRVPGSELKEAFLPTNGLWANQELTKNLSVEGFYLTQPRQDPHRPARHLLLEQRLRLGRRDARDPVVRPPPRPELPAVEPGPAGHPDARARIASALYGPYDPAASVWAPRARRTSEPDDDGQYGLALRLLTPGAQQHRVRRCTT